MATRSIGTLSIDMVANTGGFVEGLGKAEKELNKLTAAEKRQQESLQRLIGQIDPVVAEMSRLDKQQQQLNKHLAEGRINQQMYDQYTRKLSEARAEVTRLNDAFNKNAISSKQMSAALRGVPAQFTDIFVSIQSGQNPLTVLLQQGGQLKDMFGGIGPAARALGTYVLGLANPYTIAAVAVGGLTAAFVAGSKEAQEYQKALILTGGAAGVSVGQLSALAEQLDGLAGVTQRGAAAALAAVAGNASFAGEQIQLVARAALQMEEATGKAVSDTVKEFENLAKKPSEASAEYNKLYNYLTAAQFEQIRLLEEQGRQQEAATLAVRAYSDAVNERTPKIQDNLGLIQRGWRFIARESAEALDAVLGIGRQQTMQEELQKLLQERARANAGGSGAGTNFVLRAQLAEEARARDERISELRKQLSEEARITSEKAEQNKRTAAAIEADREIAKLAAVGLTNEQRRTQAIEKYKKQLDAIRAANPNSAELDQATIDRNIAKINEQYKDAPVRASAAKPSLEKMSVEDYLLNGIDRQALEQARRDGEAIAREFQKGVDAGIKEADKATQSERDFASRFYANRGRRSSNLYGEVNSQEAEENAINEDLYSRGRASYQQYEDAKTAIKEEAERARAAITNRYLQSGERALDDAAFAAEALGKKGFAAFKALSIAQTVISTYRGAQEAFSSLATIPGVGPALGTAAAAAAIAAGLARVAQIRAMEPTGFELGGYTGDMGRKQVAGVVHGQEYVVNADATSRYRPMLESMNSGRFDGIGPKIILQNAPPGYRPVVNGNVVTVDMLEPWAQSTVQRSAVAVGASLGSRSGAAWDGLQAGSVVRPRPTPVKVRG